MKKVLACILIIVVVFALCSCNTEVEQEPISRAPLNLSEPLTIGEIKAEKLDEEFIKAQQDFALNLFSEYYSADKGNVCISPYSLSFALSIVANGADGKTAKEIEDVLMGGIEKDKWNKNMYSLLKEREKVIKTKQADSIWIDKEYKTVNADFLNVSKKYFNANVYQTDLSTYGIEDINAWVKENTDGKIENIADSLSPNTKLYIADALFFELRWATSHYSELVTEETFFTLNGEEQTAKMMNSSFTGYYYINTKEAVGFIKPLQVDYSFVALMPDENVNFVDYISSLNGTKFRDILNSIEYAQIDTGMPFFKVENDIIFNNTLKKMGINRAYDDTLADFSKISKTDSLVLGVTRQKTLLNVDIEGVRGSSASGQEVIYRSLNFPEISLTLNRPFVYAIIDKQGIPVFVGAVTKI
jgi:serpin B